MPPYPIKTTQDARTRPVRGPPIRSTRERRLGEFLGGQYSEYNLASLLFQDYRDGKDVLCLSRWDPPKGTKPSFDHAVQQKFKTCANKGETFGPSWTNHWIKLEIHVPNEWKGKDWIQLQFDPGCEAMIFDSTGLPLQGITGGWANERRVDFPLDDKLLSASSRSSSNGLVLYAEVSCNGMFGVESTSQGGDPDPNRYFTLDSAALVVKRPQAWQLRWDFELLKGCVEQMPKDGVLQNKALWVANEIQNTFRKNDLDSLDRCRKLAAEVLGEWEGKESLFKDKASKTPTTVWAMGHCHIDSCWLWPRSVTQQKVARSWSTQLALMERFPEHRFVASQAAQFRWMEQLYPKLFDKIQKAVKKGSFLPIGGTWVECDANLPSGESFVRQFLYGQRFFQTRFGKRSSVFWLPDTFGYNAQIPQLARSAGLDYFFTQKLSWNNVNKFPHSTVMWQGLDGSQIITHFSPVENYDSRCGLDDMVKCVKNNRNLDVQPSGLLLYGYGDGGGGPGETHLQNLRRARAIHENGYIEVPKVTIANSIEDFFDHVNETTQGGTRLPTWSGDLYLEFHRAVYTSHGSIKRWNRTLEILLHNVEWNATLASVADAAFKYPKEELDALWEMLLFNQFHDILPGSSIRMVYDDAEKDYAQIEKRAEKLLHAAQTSLVVQTENEKDVVALGAMASAARVLKPDGNSRLLKQLSMEPSYVLASDALSVRVERGRITSIYDNVHGREILQSGRTAGLTIYEDYPPSFDAWETEIYSLDTEEEIQFTDCEARHQEELGGAALVLGAKFGQSSVKVKLSIDQWAATSAVAGAGDSLASLRVELDIDWHEKHRFLRFSFPSALRADNASYETQFGLTKRPTHRNTSWDAAKFEVCGHRFADLSEADYGVALVTDCKYGYSVEGGTMRVSLLKAGTYPDAHQDEGKHKATIALYPHAKAVEGSDVIAFARQFNNPLEQLAGMKWRQDHVPEIQLRASGDQSGIVLDTLKRGESDFDYHGLKKSGSKSIVVRLYESIGAHSHASLQIANMPVHSVSKTNILEDDVETLQVETLQPPCASAGLIHRLPIHLAPFEICTLKITFA